MALRRATRWIVVGTLFLSPLLAVVGHTLFVRFNLQRIAAGLDDQRAKAHSLELPLRLQELEPEWAGTAEDAGPLYLEASKLWQPMSEEVTSTLLPGMGEHPTAAAIRKALRDSEPVYAILARAATKRHAWIPLDWNGLEWSYQGLQDGHYREFAKLLSGRAEALADAGDWVGAWASMRALGAVIAHAGDCVELNAWLMSGAIESIWYACFQRLLNKPGLNAATLAGSLRVLDKLPPAPDLGQAWSGEFADRLTVFDRLSEYERELAEVQPSFLDRLTSVFTGDRVRYDLSAFHVRWQDPKLVERAYQTALLQRWTPMFEAMKGHWDDPALVAKQLGALDKAIQSATGPTGRMERQLAELRGDSLGELINRSQARRLLVRAAVRVLDARFRTGQWPVDLAELGDVPLDPFDGKPLRYSTDGRGFLLYSVGRGRAGGSTWDLTFEVKSIR